MEREMEREREREREREIERERARRQTGRDPYRQHRTYEETKKAAECCAPVWSRSPHVKKVDVAINNSLRTISGCLKPTPVFQLTVLAGIAPAGQRRKAATLAMARKAVKHDWHILHDTTKNEVPPCRLNSRKPYNKKAQEKLSVISEDRSKDAWIAATWKQEWEASGPTRVQTDCELGSVGTKHP